MHACNLPAGRCRVTQTISKQVRKKEWTLRRAIDRISAGLFSDPNAI
jgi:hypothetical protein